MAREDYTDVVWIFDGTWPIKCQEPKRRNDVPNETRNLIVKIPAPDLAALLMHKAMEMLPPPPPGQRVIVDWQGLPRYRSVQSTVSCEIDIKYHIEDVEPGVPNKHFMSSREAEVFARNQRRKDK